MPDQRNGNQHQNPHRKVPLLLQPSPAALPYMDQIHRKQQHEKCQRAVLPHEEQNPVRLRIRRQEELRKQHSPHRKTPFCHGVKQISAEQAVQQQLHKHRKAVMIYNLCKQGNDQRMKHRVPGIVLAVLNLPPLIQVVPVKGPRKIRVEINHQPGKYQTEAQKEPESAPHFFFFLRSVSVLSRIFVRNTVRPGAALFQLRAGKTVYAPLQPKINRHRHKKRRQNLDCPVFCIHGNRLHHLRQKPEQEDQIKSHSRSQNSQHNPRAFFLLLIPSSCRLDLTTHFQSASLSAPGRFLQETHWSC